MLTRRSLIAGAAAACLSACGGRSALIDGKRVTLILVDKSARAVHLLHNQETLRSYPIELGFAPAGHKQFRGDGKTPEGTYRIDRRNPESEYFLSVGLSYPNSGDVAYARERGKSPGGDIFIHGTPRKFRGKDDWTAGCIAVSNRAMREIYRSALTGTPVRILP